MPGRVVWTCAYAVGLMLCQFEFARAEQVQSGPATSSAQGGQSAIPPAPVAQDSAAPVNTPAKTPAEMYKEDLHPLDLVRASLSNWSDAELGALAVGMHQAGEQCAAADRAKYQGSDLYDLARLCTFGQDWNDANSAALAYVNTHQEEHRAQAYALTVNALVHMNAVDIAIKTADLMLRQLPYDAEVAYAMRDLKGFLEESVNPEALALAKEEHSRIVAALQTGLPLKAEHGNAVMDVGALYESAMELAFFEQYAGNSADAASAAAEVKSAIPATAILTAEDGQRIHEVDVRYGLLGTTLPEVRLLRSLQSAASKAQLGPGFGSATVLVLFPDWCVDCRNMMKTLTQFAEVNRDTPIHAYGLVFADYTAVLGEAAHEQNFKEMRGTQTFVVPVTAVQDFGASEFPLAIVLDHAGKVRFIGTIPGNAFNGDSYIGKIIVRMVKASGGGLKNSVKHN